MAKRTIAGLLDRIALKTPDKIALIGSSAIASSSSASSKLKLTYQEVSDLSNQLAGWLSLYGYDRNDVIVSDLPNSTENIILQLACNRLGVIYGTAKNLEQMANNFPKVKGSVATTSSGFLAETNLPVPYLSGEFLHDLIHNNGILNYEYESLEGEAMDDSNYNVDSLLPPPPPHGQYNSKVGYTNEEALEHGEDAAFQLSMYDGDINCISITLCHPFGIGSAVCSTLLRGATIALPAIHDIHGCGVPSERASTTYEMLKEEQCTLLFADTHTLKALPTDKPITDLVLRGGVCKIGSGSTFLPNETRSYGGVSLMTMGKI